MKQGLVITTLIFAMPCAAVARNSDKDAVKAVINAVKHSEDLATAFPGAISVLEIASLRRVSKCSALNLMKQNGGYYTVVWDCGSKGALGMQVVVTKGQVTSISTMSIGMRPNTR